SPSFTTRDATPSHTYALSLHDALPISVAADLDVEDPPRCPPADLLERVRDRLLPRRAARLAAQQADHVDQLRLAGHRDPVAVAEIGRAHVRTPVTGKSRMPASA